MSATEIPNEAFRKIAARHNFDDDAAAAMASALVAGNGTMAQFNHPGLGGMGQWSLGGMLMIGDMFNDSLKARVAVLAEDLSRAVLDGRLGREESSHKGHEPRSPSSEQWWPAHLGAPSSRGGQNGRLYAVFPEKRRLAFKQDDRVTVFDTAEHRIFGVSQQQGATERLSFATANGSVTVDELRAVADGE